MPTDAEVRVMKVLTAIEVPDQAASLIESLGNEAVTVACEAALGSYPGLSAKARTNAAHIVGEMGHVQARETLEMLIADENMDVAVRAVRAAARRPDAKLVALIGGTLRRPATDPFVANEAVLALRRIDTDLARKELEDYRKQSPDRAPHRASPLVRRTLDGARDRRRQGSRS